MEKPTAKRKEREKEARKHSILEAAARVFSRKNFGEATLDEIAIEAELSKGTLYNYFKDKQDLFDSLMDHGHEHFLLCFEEAIGKSKSIESLIGNLFTNFIGTLFEHHYLVRMILTSGMCSSDGDCSEVIIDWHRRIEAATQKIADAFGDLDEGKDIPYDDRLSAAVMIIAVSRYLFLIHVREEYENRLKSEIENYTRLISRGLNIERDA
ncbi:MAG: TetR/AcrR family transcriptional regulator [candidate division Zixibacteria bacterium]